MFYENAVIPTRDQLKAFGEANHGKEIFMVISSNSRKRRNIPMAARPI